MMLLLAACTGEANASDGENYENIGEVESGAEGEGAAEGESKEENSEPNPESPKEDSEDSEDGTVELPKVDFD